jgi:hypothetical protein
MGRTQQPVKYFFAIGSKTDAMFVVSGGNNPRGENSSLFPRRFLAEVGAFKDGQIILFATTATYENNDQQNSSETWFYFDELISLLQFF